MQEALKGYSEVIKMAPDLMEPYLFRAIIFNEKGMYEKAIEDITNAIKYDTDKSSNLFTLRGEIYSTANKNEEAFADFKQAIQITPSIAKNYRGLMYTCLLYTSPSPRDRTRSRMPSSAWKKKQK